MKEGNGACWWLNRPCSLIIMKTNVKTLVANVIMEWMLLDATLHWLSIAHDLQHFTLQRTSNPALCLAVNTTFTCPFLLKLSLGEQMCHCALSYPHGLVEGVTCYQTSCASVKWNGSDWQCMRLLLVTVLQFYVRRHNPCFHKEAAAWLLFRSLLLQISCAIRSRSLIKAKLK